VTGNITLACAGCSPNGQGVTIIFTTVQGTTIGTLSSTANLTITRLNAPRAGSYAGLLMVQDTVPGVTPAPVGTVGNGNPTLGGLLYFPGTSLSLTGNIQTDASNCLVAVASSLSLTGNIGLNASGCQMTGLATPPAVLSVFLAV
jgi:hypothetical protein